MFNQRVLYCFVVLLSILILNDAVPEKRLNRISEPMLADGEAGVELRQDATAQSQAEAKAEDLPAKELEPKIEVNINRKIVCFPQGCVELDDAGIYPSSS